MTHADDPDRDRPDLAAALDGNIVLPLDEATDLYAERGDAEAFDAMAAAWHHHHEEKP